MRHESKTSILSCADEHGNRYVKTPGRHRILTIVAPLHGKHWTLDPAGAAYGIQIKTMTTSSYERSHVNLKKGHRTVYDFGYHKRKLQRFAKIDGRIGLPYKLLFVAADYLHLGVDEWMLQSKLTLPQMLRRPDDEYVTQLRLLRSCVHGFMSSVKMGSDYSKIVQEALRT
jgi:hypothetical protein